MGFSPTRAAIENADAFEDNEGLSSSAFLRTSWIIVGGGEGVEGAGDRTGDGLLLTDDAGDASIFGESIVVYYISLDVQCCLCVRKRKARNRVVLLIDMSKAFPKSFPVLK